MKFSIVAVLCLLGLVNASFYGSQGYPESHYYGPYRHLDQLVQTPWLHKYSYPSWTYPYGYGKGYETPKYYNHEQFYPYQKLWTQPKLTGEHVKPIWEHLKPVSEHIYGHQYPGLKNFYPEQKVMPFHKYASTPYTVGQKYEGEHSYGYPYAYYPYGYYPYGSEKTYGHFPYGIEKTHITPEYVPLLKKWAKEIEQVVKTDSIFETPIEKYIPEQKWLHAYGEEKIPREYFGYPKYDKVVPFWNRFAYQQYPYQRYQTSEYLPKSLEYSPVNYGLHY